MALHQFINGMAREAKRDFYKTGLSLDYKVGNEKMTKGFNKGYKYEVVYCRDENEEFGLKGGRICSITITSIYGDGNPTVHYCDGRWRTKPSGNRDANALYNALVRKYN